MQKSADLPLLISTDEEGGLVQRLSTVYPSRPSAYQIGLSNSTAFAAAQGLQVIYKKEYESPRFPEMRSRKPGLAVLLDTVATVMNFLLLGKAEVRHGDYHVILQKR